MNILPNVAAIDSLDNVWYERFKGLVFEDYEKLTGDGNKRAEQKEDFLSGKITNPTLDYPELQSFDGEGRIEALESLLVDIKRDEINATVKKLYQAKIEETMALVRMLNATKHGDDVSFFKEAQTVYGELFTEDVKYVLAVTRKKAESVAEKGDKEQIEAAKRLLKIIPDISLATDDAELLLPPLRPAGSLVASADIAKEVFSAELQKLGIDDWSVVINEPAGITNFSVSQEYKTIHIPSTEILIKRAMSSRKLRGLAAHEIGAHVYRRFNGAKSKLRLLGLGLDGYIKGDEGVATYLEQKVTGASIFAGVARFFSIAVALGRCDGVARDFRETFLILCDYRLLFKREAENRLDYIRSLAYNDCVRIFRGTTCTTKGVVYPKDIAYFTNRSIWHLVKNNPEIEATFCYGKFDPTNDRHMEALIELGII